MSASNDMPAKQYSPWKALFGASAIFLIFIVFNFIYSNGAFVWAVERKFGGDCSSFFAYAGPASYDPLSAPILWLNWQMIFLNPGFWFGITFSLMYAPSLMSRGLPTLILITMGLLGLIVANIFRKHFVGHEYYGYVLAGMPLVAAPYSALGALAGYVYSRITQNE